MQKQVTLDPEQSQRVSFLIAPTAKGDYSVQLDGLAGEFSVLELASLIGQVVDADTALPIGGVAVTLNAHETTTNIYGSYSFHDIDPGDYVLTASKDGFNTKTINVTLVAGDNTLDIILVPEVIPAAEFEVSDLGVSPTIVNVGEAVEIGGTVTNIGTAVGIYTVNCDVTPSTFTPLEIAPAVIPWGGIVNMMVLMMFMSVVMNMMREA